MTKLPRTITGEVSGWKFTFDQAKLNDWVIMQDLGNVSMDKTIEQILPRLKAVENLVYDDGETISYEQVAAKEAPMEVYFRMVVAWSAAVGNRLRGEAEAKNEQTNES